MSTPKLGQHFLNDESVIKDILSAANLNSKDFVLEVGPGKGILTEGLVKHAGMVLAIEKDEELFDFLKQKFKGSANLNLINQDVRDLDLEKLPKDYKFVANIPYYLTGQLIRDFLSSRNPPSVSVLMLQKEVAERLTGKKGEGSLLQLASELFSDIEIVTMVPKSKFSPPPKVDSAVVRFTRKAKLEIKPTEQKTFFRLLKFAFAGKRKKLTNTLGSALNMEKEDLLNAFREVGIPENARPQELDLALWIKLYKYLISIRLL